MGSPLTCWAATKLTDFSGSCSCLLAPRSSYPGHLGCLLLHFGSYTHASYALLCFMLGRGCTIWLEQGSMSCCPILLYLLPYLLGR